jgi:hypothetical protein
LIQRICRCTFDECWDSEAARYGDGLRDRSKVRKILFAVFALTGAVLLVMLSVSLAGIQKERKIRHEIEENAASLAESDAQDRVYAAKDSGSGRLPVLIQAVDDAELYRGLVAYGDYTVHPLSADDTEKASESVKGCIVRICMSGADGSGIVWKMEPDRLIIVTNRHVLAYWNDQTGYIGFCDGAISNAEVIGTSGRYDVGFLQIPSGWLDYTSLSGIRQALYDMDVYNAVQHGSSEFSLGSASGVAADFYPGFVDSKDTYMPEFGENMLYCDSNAVHGMSGGGTFDGRGYLIGMITGGSDYNVSVSVPLPSIIKAYNTLVSR